MDQVVALKLLENLLDRAKLEHGRLSGLTKLEIEALEVVLASLSPAAGHVEAPSVVPASKPLEVKGDVNPVPAAAASVPNAGARLVLDPKRLQGLTEPEVTLCLDFGTARSKAFATRRTAEGQYDLLDLALGTHMGEPAVYPLTSSVWITDRGEVFFGSQANDRSAPYEANEALARERLDSLKQWFSQGDLHYLATPLTPAQNPVGSVQLTLGDVLKLYLAYLTDAAETALELDHRVSKYVRRRFALPWWNAEKASVVEGVLRDYLAQAQILADTFHGRWASGISLYEAKVACEQVSQLRAQWPLALIERGVPEAIAAGAGRADIASCQWPPRSA